MYYRPVTQPVTSHHSGKLEDGTDLVMNDSCLNFTNNRVEGWAEIKLCKSLISSHCGASPASPAAKPVLGECKHSEDSAEDREDDRSV